MHSGYTLPPERVRKISKWADILAGVVILELDWQVLGWD